MARPPRRTTARPGLPGRAELHRRADRAGDRRDRRGFVYAASLMGVTGARQSVGAAAEGLVERVRAVTDAAGLGRPRRARRRAGGRGRRRTPTASSSARPSSAPCWPPSARARGCRPAWRHPDARGRPRRRGSPARPGHERRLTATGDGLTAAAGGRTLSSSCSPEGWTAERCRWVALRRGTSRDPEPIPRRHPPRAAAAARLRALCIILGVVVAVWLTATAGCAPAAADPGRRR